MGYFQNATLVMIFLMGIVLAVLSSMIDSEASDCNNKDLQNANKGVLVIAVLAMTLPITYLICNWRCNCGESKDLELINYSILFLLLGIVLIGLGATISMNADDCKKVKSTATGVWSIGTIFTVLSLIQIGMTVGKKTGLLKKKRK